MANIPMKTLTIGESTYEVIDATARSDIKLLRGQMLTIDTTLSIEGQAADAKAVGDALTGKSSLGHIHTAKDIGAAPLEHTHDDLYFTQLQIVEKLENKSNINHTHTLEDLGAANIQHNHTIIQDSESNKNIKFSYDSLDLTDDSEIFIAAWNELDDENRELKTMSMENLAKSMGATGLANLFAAGATILSSNQYGDTLEGQEPIAGRIFFKRANT